jgi:hypothetical protein
MSTCTKPIRFLGLIFNSLRYRNETSCFILEEPHHFYASLALGKNLNAARALTLQSVLRIWIGRIQTFLVGSGRIRTFLVGTGPFLVGSGPFWSDPVRSGPFWSDPDLFGGNRTFLVGSGPFWSDPVGSGPFWSDPVRSGPFLSDPDLFGRIWIRTSGTRSGSWP